MTPSRNTGHSTRRTPSLLDVVPRLSRYDVVLAAIPLFFALALTGHVLFAVSLQLAIAAGALASGVLVLDVRYLNPPSDSGGTTP